MDLLQQVGALFQQKAHAASVALFSALYPVRCPTRHVPLLGVHNVSAARAIWSGIDNIHLQARHPLLAWVGLTDSS